MHLTNEEIDYLCMLIEGEIEVVARTYAKLTKYDTSFIISKLMQQKEINNKNAKKKKWSV